LLTTWLLQVVVAVAQTMVVAPVVVVLAVIALPQVRLVVVHQPNQALL
jgi:Tfp pilus assembly major pilin PilA